MATTIKTTVCIKAPASNVWSALMNPGLMPEWLTNFKKIEHVAGVSGAAGSKNKLTFLEKGKEVVVHEEVIQVKEKAEYVFKMVGPGMSSHNRVHLNEESGNTVLTETVAFYPHGVLMKIMMPLLKKSMQKRMLKDLTKLRKLIEC